MRISKIKDFTNGWFVGNFEPTLIKTPDIEVAHHCYSKGTKSVPHYHKIATEYNYVLKGKVDIAGLGSLSVGDIFIYEPNEISDVYFVKDTELIIIKVPSLPDDKYLVES